ncbi:MAG: AIPR family protein [Oscillospiraceae bacterium]
MGNFKQQIIEDIEYIQKSYQQYNPFLGKEEYTFNYWILTKLYNIDEEVVDENITEYCDCGIDCFVYFEEAKELFIIQNKYYSEYTPVNRNYVQQDFLFRPLNALKNGNYSRSSTLQNIYNKYKGDSDFRIHLCMYVSNDLKDETVTTMFAKYQNTDPQLQCYVDASVFYLSDIKHQFYEDRREDTKKFQCAFYTVNDGTFLNINKENYNLPNLIEAKYILTPVSQIYEIIKLSKEKEYPLFAENIREYLGNKGINSKIAKTLENSEDRANFFYYNNGITVICDSVKKENTNNSFYNRKFIAQNPQIVNGCQTVNTIYEVLSKCKDDDIISEFKDTFVMLKLLILDKGNESHEALYKNIVKYNNSQNSINEKAFEANKALFFNMQRDLEKRGFLLSVKQSDSYKFRSQKKFNEFRPLLSTYEDLFAIKFDKIDDVIIPLEKFLQVILAFNQGGDKAFSKKSQVLKLDSPINASLTNFIKNSGLTTDDFLNIYLLFLKAEKDKKLSEDKRTPIPYYLIGFIGMKLKNKSVHIQKITLEYIFKNKENLQNIYSYFKNVTKSYKINYKRLKDIEYNQMIKSPIDNQILFNSFEDTLELEDSSIVKNTVRIFNQIII